MTIYECERCHYSTCFKGNMKKHFQKSIPCPATHSTTDMSILLENLLKPKDFQCRHCSKSFAFLSNLSRHISKEHPSKHTKRLKKNIDKYKNYVDIVNKKAKVENIPETVLAYIYLLREREFVRLNEAVYKHGKTRQKFPCNTISRLNDYKQGSELVMIKQVPEHLVDEIERNITRTFKHCFEGHEDGREYFVGDPFEMMDVIDDIIRDICSRDMEETDDGEDEEYDEEEDEDYDEEDEEHDEEEDEEDTNKSIEDEGEEKDEGKDEDTPNV